MHNIRWENILRRNGYGRCADECKCCKFDFDLQFDLYCLYCRFVSQDEVERDETGDLKVFRCEVCLASFTRRNKLISHEREHEPTGSQLKCSYCSKSFPSNSTLARHIRVHTGEKPFKCEICGRAFIQKEILKRHLMIHTGERPFKCDQCSKSFILKEALKQHINRNHMANPVIELHKCPLCPKVRRYRCLAFAFELLIFCFLLSVVLSFIRPQSAFVDSRRENIQMRLLHKGIQRSQRVEATYINNTQCCYDQKC